MRAGTCRAAIPAAVLSLVAAMPAAAAAAPTLVPGQSCYLNTGNRQATVTVSGSGWGAGDTVEVSANQGGLGGNLTADAGGNLSGSIGSTPLNTFGPGVESFTLTATDQGNPTTGTFPSPAPTATATVTVANAAVQTTPNSAPPRKVVKWVMSGIPAGPIYVHFVHGRRAFDTVRFGTSRGPCSLFATRKPIFPSHVRRFSHYTVQVDNSRRYSPKTRGAVRAPFELLSF